ncbi:MAG: CCA tRNA nucleotidyltransferase [Patescibacteria group bacterium]
MPSLNTKILIWKAKTSSEKLALKLIEILKKSGFIKTYIVGGYVRDLFLKRKETGAIDLASEARPEQVTAILRRKGFSVIPTGLKHGTVTVHKNGLDVEITTFRKEGKYPDFRRPEKVSYIKDPAADSSRRDFTINALYFDPKKSEVTDYQGGISDLSKKVLRFVGSAATRIYEDPLRLMRAVRFATVLGFKLSQKDQKIIKRNSALISKISAERVKAELDKIMLSQNRSSGLRLLREISILKQVLPEVELLAKTRQSKNYHSEGDVFTHTLLGLSKIEKSADLKTLYGLLFHDAGKAQTLQWIKKHGRSHSTFYGHQQVGEELAKKAMKRLRFSKAEITDIAWYVKNHHVPYELSKMRKSKQMGWCLDPRFENLLKLYRADSLSSIPTDAKGKKLKPSLKSYNFSTETLKAAKSKKVLRQKIVSGNDVMKILKIGAGPEVGRVLNQLRDLQLGGKIKTKKEALEYLKKNS